LVSSKTRLVVLTGVLSALAFALYFFEFPLAFIFPPFLKIDFSDVPAIIGGLAAGPVVGVAVQLIKNILHFLLISKEPMASGEIANFFAGVGYMLPVILISSRSSMASDKGIYKIMPYVAGTLIGTVAINIVNYFITLPLYGMTDATEKMNFIITAGIPFNLVKWTIVSVTTVVLCIKLKGEIRRIVLKKV